MITTHNINAWRFIATMPDKSVDVIITDPLYKDDVNMQELERVCKGHIILFCDPRHRFFEVTFNDEVAIWMKPPSSKNTSKHLAHPFEEILIKRQGYTYNAEYESANYNGVYYDILFEKRKHPFQKPASLIERLVAIYSNPNDVILDPFFGSGITLDMAEKLGRSAIGCEINPDYYNEYQRSIL